MSESTLFRLSRSTRDWLSDTVLAFYADSYVQYLVKQGYATSTIDAYLGSIAHFSRWATRRQIGLDNIKESVVSRFLEKHLPVCRCARHCRRSRVDVRAALSHLLAHLRKENIIAAKAAIISNFIAAELDAFGAFLTDVRGLCDVTQQTRLAHVRRFLLDRFPEGPVRIGSLLPKDIDRFIMKKMGGVEAIFHQSHQQFTAKLSSLQGNSRRSDCLPDCSASAHSAVAIGGVAEGPHGRGNRAVSAFL